MKNVLFYTLVSVTILLASCKFPGKQDDIEPIFFRTDGADLMVNVDGNTDSNVFIIYLHGGPGGGSIAYNQGYYSDKMEEDYAMVYLDQRGNGSSQGNYDRSSLTIEQNSKDIYNLTQFLKAKYGENISIFLSGHSWGGITSAHALITTELQKDIKAWIEIDGAHDFAKNDIEAVKMFQKFAAEEIAAERNLDFWQPTLERINQMDTLNITNEDKGYLNSQGFEAENKFELSLGGLTSVILPFFPNNPEFGLAPKFANNIANPILNEDSGNQRLTERLHEIEIPCLFLWGKYDFVVPPAIGQSAYNLVNTEHKEFVLFEKSGHSPMSNEPELFTEKVKAFVELYK